MRILRSTCLCFRLEAHFPLGYLIQGQLVQFKLLYTDQLLVWSWLMHVRSTPFTDWKWHCDSLATRCNMQYSALQMIPQIDLCLMINLSKVPGWSTSFVLSVCLGSGLQQCTQQAICHAMAKWQCPRLKDSANSYHFVYKDLDKAFYRIPH